MAIALISETALSFQLQLRIKLNVKISERVLAALRQQNSSRE